MRLLLIATFLAVQALGCRGADPRWSRLAPIPNAEGFAGGYAGVSHGRLLFAGGANFQNGRPWEGSKKIWCDTICRLDKPDGKWAIAGRLPRPLGYGVSVTHRDRMICVAGSDATAHYSDAFAIEVRDGTAVTTPLPPLPITAANICGALVGDTLYVAGGIENPDSRQTMNRFFGLDLAAETLSWRELRAWPGPGRMLAIAASSGNAFWLVGGVDLVEEAEGKLERCYLSDAYRFDPANGWTKLPDLPHPVAAAPSPAPVGPSGPVIVGGDDGTQVKTPPNLHPGFPLRQMQYDVARNHWTEVGPPPFSRATVPTAQWQGKWLILSGEIRPGIRSPDVWSRSFR